MESYDTKAVFEWGPSGAAPRLRVTVENVGMDYANSVEVQTLAMEPLAKMLAWAQAKADVAK